MVIKAMRDISVTMASKWVPGGFAELSISQGITYAFNVESPNPSWTKGEAKVRLGWLAEPSM